MSRLPRWAPYALLLTVGACMKNLTDADLLSYASRPFDKEQREGKHVELGNHHGALVVADYPCADLCPDHTVRVIHYDVTGALDCARVGGLSRTVWVPEGIGNAPRISCLPRVLAEEMDKQPRWP